MKPEDLNLIDDIAARALTILARVGSQTTKLDIIMDLTAVHTKVVPLDLQRLRDATDFNLIHDVCGIRAHLDRENLAMKDYFEPRFVRR